jgi:hypothetical protein
VGSPQLADVDVLREDVFEPGRLGLAPDGGSPDGARPTRDGKTFTRSRPQRTKKNGGMAAATMLARNLMEDTRYLGLTTLGRHVLLVAAIKYSSIDGAFYVKQERLADHAGASREAVNRLLKRAERLGLIQQEYYLRPKQKGQGASNYRFDSALNGSDVSSEHTAQTPILGMTDDHTREGVTSDYSQDGVTADHTLLNEDLNEKQMNGAPCSPPQAGDERRHVSQRADLAHYVEAFEDAVGPFELQRERRNAERYLGELADAGYTPDHVYAAARVAQEKWDYAVTPKALVINWSTSILHELNQRREIGVFETHGFFEADDEILF